MTSDNEEASAKPGPGQTVTPLSIDNPDLIEAVQVVAPAISVAKLTDNSESEPGDTGDVCEFVSTGSHFAEDAPQKDNLLEEGLANSESLWAQTCGYRHVLSVALPLVVSMMSFTIMHFCDRLFLTWYSTESMAAVMPAGMLSWTLFSFPMGIAAYAATFVSQHIGANQPDRVGALLWQALRLALYTTPLFMVVGLFAVPIFKAFDHPQNLIWLETIYFQIVSMGAGAAVFGSALSSFFLGQGKTRMIMAVDTFASLVNLVLDYWLIFGGLGVAAMGIEGAAWATMTAMWVKVVVFAVCVFRPRHLKPFRLWSGRRFDLALFLRLLRFGGPNGLQFVIEGSAITLFVLFIGRSSTDAAAATTLAFSFNLVTFVPVIGLGMAISTLVGQQIGAKQPHLAARATIRGVHLAILYSLFFVVLYWGAPRWVISTFETGDQDLDRIIPIAVILLRFVGAYCILDALQVVFVSALKGAGDTFFVLLGTVATSFSAVALGIAGSQILESYLGEETAKANEVYWWWSLITIWIFSLAILFGWRFRQGKWRKMSVIEQP